MTLHYDDLRSSHDQRKELHSVIEYKEYHVTLKDYCYKHVRAWTNDIGSEVGRLPLCLFDVMFWLSTKSEGQVLG